MEGGSQVMSLVHLAISGPSASHATSADHVAEEGGLRAVYINAARATKSLLKIHQ
jgi:hypothetical protein